MTKKKDGKKTFSLRGSKRFLVFSFPFCAEINRKKMKPFREKSERKKGKSQKKARKHGTCIPPSLSPTSSSSPSSSSSFLFLFHLLGFPGIYLLILLSLSFFVSLPDFSLLHHLSFFSSSSSCCSSSSSTCSPSSCSSSSSIVASLSSSLLSHDFSS